METPLSQLSLPDLAQKTLGNDEEVAPPEYLKALAEYRIQCPHDVNFNIELGQNGKCGVGGKGFGVISCMEDYCWEEISLGPHPEIKDGGIKAGIGSLDNYKKHCRVPMHIKGRTERLKKGNIVKVEQPKIFQDMAKHHHDAAHSVTKRASRPISRTSSVLQSLPVNTSSTEPEQKPEIKPSDRVRAPASTKTLPRVGSSEMPILLSDDSDDEVCALLDHEVPEEFRKKTNKDNPIVLSDEDDDTPSRPPPVELASIFKRRPKPESKVDLVVHPPLTPTPASAPIAGPSTRPASGSDSKLGHTSAAAAALSQLGADATQNSTRPVLQTYQGPVAVFLASKELAFLATPAAFVGSTSYDLASRHLTQRQAHCWCVRDAEGAIAYARVPPATGAALPALLRESKTWEASAQFIQQAYRDKSGRGEPYASGRSHGSLSGVPSLSGPVMPGAYDTKPSIIDLPSVPGPSSTTLNIPGWDDGPDWGYEHDRPTTSEGLTSLFQSAVDDFHEDTTVDDAMLGIGLTSLEDTVPGLKFQLMPHQVIGVDWMVKREAKQKSPGGILGDEMGLGKTVQTIALMVRNPSRTRHKTTLIVVPLALLRQWKMEIESKSNLTALIYHGNGKTKSLNVLKNVDVVLTTYGCLTGERPQEVDDAKKKKKKKKQPGDPGYDSFVSDDEFERPRKKGLLFQMKWYRVILDEAAQIRNKSTISSKAVTHLDSQYNWCLTGTLIYNTLDDVFPYLRFIGVLPWDDFRDKVSKIAKRKPAMAAKRVQVLLQPVLLRRTKESEYNGKKILQLPPKTVELVELEFTPEERAMYASIERRARIRVNKYLRAGTVLKNYHVILVMLTRLRQLCCHPWLLRAKDGQRPPDGLDLTVTDEEIFGDLGGSRANDEEEYARAVALLGQPWVEKVVDKLKKRYENMVHGGPPPATQARVAGDENDYTCPVCFEPYDDERITTCQHSFCAQCIEDVLNSPARDAHQLTEEQMGRHVRLCPLCRAEVSKQNLFRADALYKPPEDAKIEELDDTGESSGTAGAVKREADEALESPKSKKSKGQKDMPIAIDLDEEDLDARGIEQVVPSTKMKEIGDILDQIYARDTAEKTLVFCNFVEMLDLMAIFLERRGIPHIMYHGGLKQDDREDAIAAFNDKSPDAPRVMLLSTKCGGVGLNLTVANNVIGLEVSWSPASEAQAIDRAHRIGQRRPVTVKRLVINNSVDQRILALQATKKALADGALGEGTVGKLGRLTPRELVRLFGSDRDD